MPNHTTSTPHLRWVIAYGLPGFLGSVFMSIGSLGVGWFPLSIDALQWPIVNYLQTQTVGLALSRSLVVVGAALLLQAWLVIGIDTLHSKTVSLRELYLTLTLWAAPLLFAAPLFSRDVYSYYMQGRLQLDSHNPYDSGVALVPGWFNSGVDPMWADAKTPYGPGFLLIEKVIAQLSGDSSFVASYLFRLVAVISVAMLALGVAKLADLHGIDSANAVWLAVLNPLVIMHLIAGSHNDGLMVACSVIALVYSGTHRFVRATILATVALAIKPVAIVVLPFIALSMTASTRIRDRVWALTKVTAIATLSLTALSAVANVGPLGWLGALGTPGAVRSWISPMTALGIGSGQFFSLMGFVDAMEVTIPFFRLIGALALAITLVYLTIKPNGRTATRSAAFAFAALVFLGPVVQPWYLLWTIPLLAASGLTRHQLRAVIIVICAFTVHGIANASATADTFIEFSDGIAMVAAAVILGLAIFASPRERELILGDHHERALFPETTQAREKYRSLQIN